MKVEDFKAPKHLSKRSREIWQQIVPEKGRSLGFCTLLQNALEALDRVDEVREILRKEGLTTKTKSSGAIHLHPLLRVEKDQRQLFVKCWGQLHLTWDHSIDGWEKWEDEQ